MFARIVNLGLSVVTAMVFSCQPRSKNHESNPPSLTLNNANLSLFVDGASHLSGSPNLYELNFTFPNHESIDIHRRGDLPQEAGLITETSLPSGRGITITADLFRDVYDTSKKTHSCRSRVGETLELTHDQTASISLLCVPMSTALGGEPAEVFIAVTSAHLDLEEGRGEDRFSDRDWSRLSLFSQYDRQGRRVSARAGATSLLVHLGGDLSFLAVSSDPQVNLLRNLVTGAAITVEPIAGKHIQAVQESAQVQIDGQILLLQGSSTGVPRFILPVRLSTGDGTVLMRANLVEEVAANEFTVVAYNAENIFDQVDEDRNSTYGDYRIAANSSGASSNYGQPVTFEGQSMSFTDVKLRGIRKVLLGIDPLGPEIVALEEIESAQIMQTLHTLTRDLGYVASEFSGWVPGEAPNAIGTGILSKFPIRSKTLLSVPYPPNVEQRDEPIRPIFKVVLNVNNKNLTVYINHWRSQAGPESLRKAAATVIEADLTTELAANPALDYLIVGDLNSSYNEARTMEPASNDTGSTSGINDVLHAQGNESLLLGNTAAKYNFHYEHDAAERKTHYDSHYGWACFDHMIGGNGLYDMKGITYVDNSFTVPSLFNRTLGFIFEANGTTKRWKSRKQGQVTTHEVGGFSDHVPLFARFFISKQQTLDHLNLIDPSSPDALDAVPVVP